MRVLSWLRFHRMENILLTLALAGSVAALLLLVLAGNRIFRGQSGFYAASLLALNPVFWHSGVVSARRIQLAVASLAVALLRFRLARAASMEDLPRRAGPHDCRSTGLAFARNAGIERPHWVRLEYLTDQATVPALLAWRRRDAWGIQRAQRAFLTLRFLPPFAFTLLAHLEDPGQALGMTVVVALLGGHWVRRALDNLDAAISRWHDRHDAPFIVLWTPAAGARSWLAPETGADGYPGQSATHRIRRFSAGAGLTIALPAWPAGYWRTAIRDVQRLAAERPGQTLVIWEQGAAAWRKVAYYAGAVPIAVLEHRYLRAGSPPVIALWKGPRPPRRTELLPNTRRLACLYRPSPGSRLANSRKIRTGIVKDVPGWFRPACPRET